MVEHTPGTFLGTKEEAALARLVKETNKAKIEKEKDRFNLPPVGPGYVRGIVINLRPYDVPCEFGVLQVVDFEIADTPKGPGVPVRMTGTYFNTRLRAMTVLDVPDPTPSVRPITPNIVYSAHDHEHEIQAFYPGRGETPRRTTLTLGLLGLIVPVVFVIVSVIVLYAFHIVT
jgi:hypothetical protein